MELQKAIEAVDIEQEIDHLVERYESVLAAAGAARAEYQSLRTAPLASAAAIHASRTRWQQLERSRAALRRALELLEDRADR